MTVGSRLGSSVCPKQTVYVTHPPTHPPTYTPTHTFLDFWKFAGGKIESRVVRIFSGKGTTEVCKWMHEPGTSVTSNVRGHIHLRKLRTQNSKNILKECIVNDGTTIRTDLVCSRKVLLTMVGVKRYERETITTNGNKGLDTRSDYQNY